MCVIMIANGTRPTEEMVNAAYETNSKGAGVAWRDKDGVRWAKGLNKEELQKYVKELPLPFIMHCRIDTCGGDAKELTHPFQVDVRSSIALAGFTKGPMMFHNGHWGPWKDKLLDLAIKKDVKLPGGRWSDSRAMAFTAAVCGIPALELIDEKAAVITGKDIQVFGSGWAKVNDVWCSNRNWEGRVTTYGTFHHGVKREAPPEIKEEKGKESTALVVTPKSGTPGGESPATTFPKGNGSIQDGLDQSKGVEAGKEGVQQGGRPNEEGSVQKIPLIPSGSRVGLRTEAERREAIEYVRSLNPSPFRRPLADDQTERDRRLANARRGIVDHGRL